MNADDAEHGHTAVLTQREIVEETIDVLREIALLWLKFPTDAEKPATMRQRGIPRLECARSTRAGTALDSPLPLRP